jgi:hypothetical protein
MRYRPGKCNDLYRKQGWLEAAPRLTSLFLFTFLNRVSGKLRRLQLAAYWQRLSSLSSLCLRNVGIRQNDARLSQTISWLKAGCAAFRYLGFNYVAFNYVAFNYVAFNIALYV